MRDYIYQDNLFVELFDSNDRNSLFLELDESRYLIILTIDTSLMEIIKKNQNIFIGSEISIEFIIKTISESLSEFEKLNGLFAGILDFRREFFSFVNYNTDFLFIKKNQNLEIISNCEEVHKRRIHLNDLDSIFITNSKKAGEIFNINHKSLLFAKEISDKLEKEMGEKNFSFIYINNELNKKSSSSYTYRIKAKKSEINEIEERTDMLFENRQMLPEEISNIMIVFNELLLNAYEHGSLKIGGAQKQKLIEENRFDEYKLEQESSIDSYINISLTFFNEFILKISIEDEGNGFDYNKAINTLECDFRGRGLVMSRSISNALFFTKQGRKVLFFIRLINQNDKTKELELDNPLFYTENLKILYVEDDKFILNTISRILKKYTNNLITAQNGADGLDSFKSLNPDLIITDIEMPRMNGLEMCKEIRAINSDIPIVLTTAYNESDILLNAINIGVDKFLVKPIKLNALEKIIIKIAKDIFLKREAKKMLKKEQEIKDEELMSLRLKDKNIASAQQIALEKERLIILDERKLIENVYTNLIYKPLEILSGDIYGVAKLDSQKSLYYIVDSMGKGLGASVTATLSAAFINRSISLSLKKNNFIFKKLILDYIDYIKSYLLDYEAVSFIFLMVDMKEQSIQYGSFGMYPILFKHKNKVVKIKANNPPLLKYLSNYKVSSFKYSDEFELLIYSDGMIESETFSLSNLTESLEKENLFETTKDIILNKQVLGEFDDDLTAIFVSNSSKYLQ